jgi:hypothetical protein
VLKVTCNLTIHTERIIAFPLQNYFHESATVLRGTCIAYLIYYVDDKTKKNGIVWTCDISWCDNKCLKNFIQNMKHLDFQTGKYEDISKMNLKK